MATVLDTEREGGTGRGRRVLPILIAAVLLFLAAAAGGAWYLGFIGGGRSVGDDRTEATPASMTPPLKPVFVDMPELLVNLIASDSRLHFMKARFALELTSAEDAQRIKDETPRILDAVQLYLRALNVDEVTGGQGMQRLKDEIKARVELIVSPVQIEDVLFNELLVQ